MVALVKNYMFGFEDVLKCVMELPRNFYVESIFFEDAKEINVASLSCQIAS